MSHHVEGQKRARDAQFVVEARNAYAALNIMPGRARLPITCVRIAAHSWHELPQTKLLVQHLVEETTRKKSPGKCPLASNLSRGIA